MKRQRHIVKCAGLVLFFVILTVRSGVAKAYEMPNPADFQGGNNIYAEVAMSDDVTNTLNAPSVSAKFYFNPGQKKIVDIFDGCHSLGDNFQNSYEHDADPRIPNPPGTTPNWDDNCDDIIERRVLFDFYALDVNGVRKSTIPDVRLNGQLMARNWWTSTDISFVNSDISVLSNKVEVEMEAHFQDMGDPFLGLPSISRGYINAFRLGNPSPGGFIGYISDRDFALQRRQDRHYPPGAPGYHYDENYTMRFSQPCSQLQSLDHVIRWRDADAGAAGVPQDWNVNFTLDKAPKDNPGAWQPVTFTIYGGLYGFPGPVFGSYNGFVDDEVAIGGNGNTGFGSDRYLIFRSDPNWNYRWSWNGIEENNGILANLPFDSGLAEVTECGVTGMVDIHDCDNLIGWAFDAQNTAALLDIHAYFDGSPTGTVFKPYWQPTPATQSGKPGSGSPPPGQYTVNQRPDVAAAHPGAGLWHGFQIPSSQYASLVNLKDGGIHTVDLYAISASGGPPRKLSTTPVEIGPCVDVDCSPLIMTPTNPEPGEPFSVSVGYQTVPANTVPQEYSVTINFPGVINGTQDSGPKTSPPKTTTFNNLIQNTPGRYVVADLWTVRVGHGTGIKEAHCNGTYTVGSKPYLKVFGNDALVGGNMSSAANVLTCAPPSLSPQAGIATYSLDAGGNRFRGAGVQYAASALGKIFEFPSTHQAPAASNLANSPKSLSFANTSASLPFGGLSADPSCVPNFLANYLSKHSNTPANINDFAITAATDGDYYIKPTAGALVVSGGTVGAGHKVVLYVDGDVRIDNDINFAAAGYANIDQIPYFQIVAKGSIFIIDTVHNLDGVYVAQGGDPNGQILTCTQPAGAHAAQTYNGEELYTKCGGQLKVNGSFTARQIKFLRTSGTLRASSVDEPRTSSNIAEIFNFSPEIYLAQPPDSLLNDCAFNCAYKSITSLPPVL